MNIIILANADIASNYALNLLLPELKTHCLKVFLSEKVGNLKQKPEPLLELQFFEQLLFTQLLFPLIENQQQPTNTRLKSFTQLNHYLQQPITTVSDINSIQAISEFQDFNPDLIISIRFGLILKEKIIATAKLGVINLHSGKLPEYQGVMPTFQAMLHEETEIGTTLHFIQDKSIDTGAIIDSSYIKLQRQHSYLWHLLKLYEGGTELIVKAVTTIENHGALAARPQLGKGNYFSFPDTQQISTFLNLGWKLFEVDEILNFASQYIKSTTK